MPSWSVTLGNSSKAMDPGSTQIVINPFINTHNVERTEWNPEELFMGVEIFYEQRPAMSCVSLFMTLVPIVF